LEFSYSVATGQLTFWQLFRVGHRFVELLFAGCGATVHSLHPFVCSPFPESAVPFEVCFLPGWILQKSVEGQACPEDDSDYD
jgi:hypothetical protein